MHTKTTKTTPSERALAARAAAARRAVPLSEQNASAAAAARPLDAATMEDDAFFSSRVAGSRAGSRAKPAHVGKGKGKPR